MSVPVSRLLVLCCRPMQLSPHDAEAWLRAQARGVLADGTAAQIHVTTLTGASTAWGRAWDYLITIEVRSDACAATVVNGDACARLLGDLRLMGMLPNVVVADDARTVVLAVEHR